MTNKEKCEAIMQIVTLCYENELLESHPMINSFVEAVYKTVEQKGSIGLISELMGI